MTVTFEPVAPPAQLALTAAPGQVDLTEWVARASSAHALMTGLVDSFFVPAAYKPTGGANGREIAIANGVGAILLGQSLNVDPLTALQNIYVVHGRPGMYAKFKVALCQSRGHEIWTDERTDTSVTVSGRARGSDRVHTITITMEMAERAGWTSNPAYKKTPQDMLWSRAAGRVSDQVGGSALFGIASIEDLEDGPDDRVRTITKVSAKDVQDRALPAAKAANPEADPVGEPAADVSTAVELISPAQIKKVQSMFTSMGVKNIDLRRDVVAYLAGHPVDSLKDVTRAEATHMIDRLEQASQAENPQGVLAEWLATADQLAEQATAEQDGDQLPVDGAEADAEADRG